MQMSKRQRQKEETRNRIVQAAFALYALQGFCTTTNEIAKAAEVSHGTIFVHFPTREDLLLCVIESLGEELCTSLHNLTETSASILDVLYAHVRAIAAHELLYTRLITERNILPPLAQNTLIIIQSTVAFHLSKVLDLEKDKGIIKDLPNAFLFNTWLGILHYYLTNQTLFTPEGSVIKALGSELIRNYFDLIKQ